MKCKQLCHRLFIWITDQQVPPIIILKLSDYPVQANTITDNQCLLDLNCLLHILLFIFVCQASFTIRTWENWACDRSQLKYPWARPNPQRRASHDQYLFILLVALCAENWLDIDLSIQKDALSKKWMCCTICYIVHILLFI